MLIKPNVHTEDFACEDQDKGGNYESGKSNDYTNPKRAQELGDLRRLRFGLEPVSGIPDLP